MNPFKLYKLLEESKTPPAPAKAGVAVPRDVVIPAGPTSISPGPLVGEMQALGIPARIEKGKVSIQKDYTVLKAGEVITDQLARILNALGIEPLEVGLNLLAAYEDGIVYTPDVLAIDESEYINMLQQAYMHAFNLSVNTAYPTSQTIEPSSRRRSLEPRTLPLRPDTSHRRRLRTSSAGPSEPSCS